MAELETSCLTVGVYVSKIGTSLLIIVMLILYCIVLYTSAITMYTYSVLPSM